MWVQKHHIYNICSIQVSSVLVAGLLGDGFGSLQDSVLGQHSRQNEMDGGLDLSAGDGHLDTVDGQIGILISNALGVLTRNMLAFLHRKMLR